MVIETPEIFYLLRGEADRFFHQNPLQAHGAGWRCEAANVVVVGLVPGEEGAEVDGDACLHLFLLFGGDGIPDFCNERI